MSETIALLKPDKKNRRKHNERNIGMIVNSLHEVGASRSIVIDEDNNILAGNGTVEAAQLAGIERMRIVDADGEEIIAVRRKGLSEEQKRRLALYDNRTAEIAEWNLEQLLEDVNEGLNFDGMFASGELNDLLKNIQQVSDEDAEPQIDKAEELRQEWNTETGQLWKIGEHRLICGDCTDKAVVDRVMGGEKAEMCFTSPPYAAQRDYGICEFDWDALMNGMSDRAIEITKDEGAIIINLGLVHKDNRVIRYWDDWLDKMDATSFPLFGWYVWDKINGLMGDWHGRLAPAHEWIFHFAKNPREARKTKLTKYAEIGVTHHKFKVGLRKKDGTLSRFNQVGQKVSQTKVSDSVIRCQPARGGVEGHPAPFSVEFAHNLIEPFTNPSEIVFEPFLGSGTTMVACENLKRKCRAIEISPGYVAVALQRMQDAFGIVPELMV